MADFNVAFNRTVAAEGGYVNDPDDKGGETYMGISRRFHKSSIIWSVIDKLKKQYKGKALNKILLENNTVQKAIKEIYKDEYWDVLCLDYVHNQKLANEIFDDAVNRGVKSTIKIVQKILGMTVTGIISDELIYNLKHYKNGKCN